LSNLVTRYIINDIKQSIICTLLPEIPRLYIINIKKKNLIFHNILLGNLIFVV